MTDKYLGVYKKVHSVHSVYVERKSQINHQSSDGDGFARKPDVKSSQVYCVKYA